MGRLCREGSTGCGGWRLRDVGDRASVGSEGAARRGYEYRCDPLSYRNGIPAHRLSPLLGSRTDDRLSKRIEDSARYTEEMNLASCGGAYEGCAKRFADTLLCID